jgi:secreted Zn-dependent insulinase-like peptidase
VGEIEFDFLDKSKPLNYTSRLASKMQQFDGSEAAVEDMIRHMYVVEQFDKPRIQIMSELLTQPQNLNIYLRSKTFSEEQCPIADPWYFTKYGKEKFSDRILQLITSPNALQTKKRLDLPPPNNLLPKNLDVLPPLPLSSADYAKKPVLLR